MVRMQFKLGLFALFAALGTLNAAPANRLTAASMKGDALVCRYSFVDPVVLHAADGDRAQLADAEIVAAPGAPLLPHFTARILIPAGRGVQKVIVEPLDTRQLDGVLRIPPAAVPVPLSRPDLVQPPRPDPAIYGSDSLIPAAVGAQTATLAKHGRSILLVRLNPIQYRPQSGRAWFTPAFTVTVTLSPPAARATAALRAPPLRSRASDRADLSLSADNPAQLDAPAAASVSALAPLGSGALPPGDFDYVIVTDTNLLATPPPYNFAALCAERRAQGLNATIVTLDWIAANYSGLRPDGGTDMPTRIRAFVADAYANWGVRYLLLGGDVAHLPARQCFADTGVPGYAENMPVDTYYGCLDGTYDGNHNGVYGEPNDGEDGGDVDLSAEVYVGRLSVAGTQEVANAVRKLLIYEAQPAAALTNICMVGEYLGFGGISDYATPTLEQIRLGGLYDGYATTGFMNSPCSNAWSTSVNLYDDQSGWSKFDLAALANQRGFQVFDHLGHANQIYNMKMGTWDLFLFTNASPFFVYSQGCDAGWFDAPDCFAEVLTTMRAGAFAAIMNARYGWGESFSTDGPSQRFNRAFWDAAFNADAAQLGRMNQLSKERWLGDINGLCMRWCYYELALFGDPATAFARPIVGGPPVIAHTPLENSTNSVDGYAVEAVIQPGSTLDAASPTVFWSANGPAGPFATAAMSRVAGSLFRATLPPQPLGTSLRYWIRAQTLSGLATTAPATAPADSYAFQITSPLNLFVLGAPADIGVPTPEYGYHALASGVTVRARAPALVYDGADRRWACRGWIGLGSVPAAGAETGLVFTIESSSVIEWQWRRQYALIQSASVAGIIDTSTWWDAGATGVTVAAAERCVRDGTNYAFVEWQWNGARYPNATDAAPLSATGVLAGGPCGALAVYLPVAQFSGTNGLPDWWQRRYFGATGVDAGADSDHDGFTNLEEYREGSNPRDALSRPRGPDIAHVALDDPQTHPAPWSVSAVIADYGGVAEAVLQWRRVPQSGWQSAAMTAAPGSDLYTAEIPAPGVFGDTFEYKIVATDSNSCSSESAAHTFFVAYPVSGVSPAAITNVLLATGAIGNRWLTITNGGNVSLVWSLALEPSRATDDVESGVNGMIHGGAGDRWQIATNRAWSGAHAWYNGDAATRLYASSTHATLQLPAVALFTNASFSFQHWIASELDSDAPEAWCWDGGIVELSTNGGASYTTLTPVGDYPYRIRGWEKSPWADGTPCFAGGGEGWTKVVFDLSAYGNQSVMLRLHFGSDDNTEREGWYADDFTLTAAAPAETWFQPAATNGILPGGSATNLAIAFRAADMLAGNRSATLWLAANCPFTPLRAIPLALRVADFFYTINQPDTNTIAITGYNGSGGEVVIPAVIEGRTVTAIGQSAFQSRPELTGVTIPASVASIGDGAFCNCANLAAIAVEDGNSAYSSLDGVLFNKDRTMLIQYPGGKAGSYTIPDGVTCFGIEAFGGCTRLTSVIVPGGVTNMGTFAFVGCTGLSTVTLGSGITGIGAYTFYCCTSLTSVTIPSAVAAIGDWAFAYCASLTNLDFEGDAPSLGADVFTGDGNLTVHYRQGKTGWGASFGGRPASIWIPAATGSHMSYSQQCAFTYADNSYYAFIYDYSAGVLESATTGFAAGNVILTFQAQTAAPITTHIAYIYNINVGRYTEALAILGQSL